MKEISLKKGPTLVHFCAGEYNQLVELLLEYNVTLNQDAFEVLLSYAKEESKVIGADDVCFLEITEEAYAARLYLDQIIVAKRENESNIAIRIVKKQKEAGEFEIYDSYLKGLDPIENFFRKGA